MHDKCCLLTVINDWWLTSLIRNNWSRVQDAVLVVCVLAILVACILHGPLILLTYYIIVLIIRRYLVILPVYHRHSSFFLLVARLIY